MDAEIAYDTNSTPTYNKICPQIGNRRQLL